MISGLKVSTILSVSLDVDGIVSKSTPIVY
jgi:hypothetical protein